MTAPDLSVTEQATVDRFGIFAEEERVDRVTEALSQHGYALIEDEGDGYSLVCPCGDWSTPCNRASGGKLLGARKRHQRHVAEVAIAALRGPSPADETDGPREIWLRS
jgi:hypothetical protein